MEILLWLVPAAVLTVLAMVWTAWRGRPPRREVDREVAAARLGVALERAARQQEQQSRRAS